MWPKQMNASLREQMCLSAGYALSTCKQHVLPPDVLDEAPHSVQLLLCSLSNGDLGPDGLIVVADLQADGIVLGLDGLTVTSMHLLYTSYLSRVAPSSFESRLIIPLADDSLQQTIAVDVA